MSKAADAFRTIAEVAEDLDVPKHVLRFWEVRFPQVRPMKRGGGRRYYRPEDMQLLRGIHRLLHAEGYTIKGVQKILREQGIEQVKAFAREGEGAAAKKRAPASRAVPAVRAAGATAGATASNRRGRGKAAGPGTRGAVDKALPLEAILAELEACRRVLLQARAPSPAASPAPRRRA